MPNQNHPVLVIEDYGYPYMYVSHAEHKFQI